METKHSAFDDNDDRVTDLFDHLAHLGIPKEREVKVRLDPQQHLSSRLQHAEHNLRKVTTAVSSAVEQAGVDACWSN